MAKAIALLALVYFASTVAAFHPFRNRMNIFAHSESQSKLQYEVDYFEQQIDHFNFAPTDPSTFQQRYIISGNFMIYSYSIFLKLCDDGTID